MRFKFTMEMKWVNDKESISIPVEHIKSLVIDSDYENRYMDICYAVLELDKNDMDKIILNAKTATIHLNLYKCNVDQDPPTNILTDFSGEMSYFINKDINYNKEIDYTEKDKDGKVIFRELNIGLMFKSAIEYNKQTTNTIVTDTTMMNAVGLFLKDYPTLMEKFTYNDTFPQLIVPPQDSLVKTVTFMNNVKVFYDTMPRFYIEPGCIYLVSSSGTPTPKKTEQYSKCYFRVNKLNDSNANIVGMDNDDKDKCYYTEINVIDTSYNMDNDTCKTLNSLSCIVDPSKDHTLSALDSINDIMSKIEDVKSTVNNAVGSVLDIAKNIPSKLFDFKMVFAASNINVNGFTAKTLAAIDALIKLVNAEPEAAAASSDTSLGVDPAKKKELLTKLAEYRKNIDAAGKQYQGITTQYANSMENTISSLGDFTNLTSYLNGIMPVNMDDNKIALSTSCIGIDTKLSDNIKYIDTTLKDRVNDLNTISSNIDAVRKIVATFPTTTDGLKYEEQIAILIQCKADVDAEAKKIADSLSEYKSYNTAVKTVLSNDITPTLETLKSSSVASLKNAFTGIKTDITNIGISAKKALNDLKNASTKIRDTLKNSKLSLSSLKDIQKDITVIKDISNIGLLGISQFKINLGLVKNGTGDSIVRVKNDNANMLKNIVSQIKNKTNTFTLNKNDLDFTVFTINKQYIIKNYYAHADKDGLFLLTRRVALFFKEDSNFTCNTILNFDKLADDVNDKAKSTTLKQDAETIVSSSQTIIDLIKGGNFDLDTLSSIIDNASTITDIYTKMHTGSYTDEELSKVAQKTKMS